MGSEPSRHSSHEPRFEAIPENPFVAPLPADFLWGVATSAHQVDGHTTTKTGPASSTSPARSAMAAPAARRRTTGTGSRRTRP